MTNFFTIYSWRSAAQHILFLKTGILVVTCLKSVDDIFIGDLMLFVQSQQK